MATPTKVSQQPKLPDEVVIAQLRTMGFSDLNTAVPRRLIASVYGQPKTGKTHFCLTAPGPIFFFNIDLGTEGVIEKHRDGLDGGPPKQIFVCNIRVPKGAAKDIYETMWAELKQKVETVYKLHNGTVVIDTATEAYEVCRLSHFGKLTQVQPYHYGPVNNEWREFMRLAYDSPMNTLLIHKVKPKYVNNVRTSEYEVSGMGEIGYLVQCNLSTYREDAEDGTSFGLKIMDCRQNAKICGTVLSDFPMNTFDFVLELVHGPKKDEE